MEGASPAQITQILHAINSGEIDAMQSLFPLVYENLRRIAHHHIAGKRRGVTLQTTALVHELYLRLLGNEQPQWENRRHFFAIAAEAIRRIVVENARRRASLKRGGAFQRITFSENLAAIESDPHLLLHFDQALSRLELNDSRMAEVVRLRCFAGLTVKETSMALQIPPRNVDRYWAAAKAWLYRETTRAALSDNTD